MGEDYYKKIFSENLRYFMEANGKSQIDLINDLGLNKSAVSTWVNGTRLPRMDKVELLANYFHVNRSDLIEEHTHEERTQYYLNEEAGELAKEMFERPELKVLFDASRNVTKEDILSVANILEKLKTYEDGDI